MIDHDVGVRPSRAPPGREGQPAGHTGGFAGGRAAVTGPEPDRFLEAARALPRLPAGELHRPNITFARRCARSRQARHSLRLKECIL
jgi:hypothetical protein